MTDKNLATDLQRLADLLKAGQISEDEFKGGKARLLSGDAGVFDSLILRHASTNQQNTSSNEEVTLEDKTATYSKWQGIAMIFGTLVFIIVAVGAAYLATKPEADTFTEQTPPVAKVEEKLTEAAPPVSSEKIDTPPEIITEAKSFRPAEPIAAPTINVGDSFTYDTTTTHADGKVTTFKSTRTVTAIDGDRVTVTVANANSNKTRTLVYDLWWNIVETGASPDAGVKYDPPIRYFDFPLTTGKKWTAISTETDKKTGKTRQHTIKGEVVGWVEDSASFKEHRLDTLKIRLETEVTDGESRSIGTDVSHYIPVLGRSGHSEIKGQDAEGKEEKKLIILSTMDLSQPRILEIVDPRVAAVMTPVVTVQDKQQSAPRVVQAQTNARETINKIGITMVDIPAGSFLMGSCVLPYTTREENKRRIFLGQAPLPADCGDVDPNARAEETPQHRVSIRSFQIGKTEVTLGQFKKFIAGAGRKDLVDDHFMKDNAYGDDAPVVGISWSGAQAFIDWLNKIDGGGYRLPSESEWEYACRAGSQHTYCGGNKLSELGWSHTNSGERPRPVAGKRANAFGLYDMSGNAGEWVQDCWNGNYNGAPIDGSAWTSGHCSLDIRAQRGGSWCNFDWDTRAATRQNGSIGCSSMTEGFRLARSR
jgi:formylglycine-generating enzyme required for sulfatase activity